MKDTDWATRILCPCGYIQEAPFGMKSNVHWEVCPKCGENKDKCKIVIARWVGVIGKWWSPKSWEAGSWEIK